MTDKQISTLHIYSKQLCPLRVPGRAPLRSGDTVKLTVAQFATLPSATPGATEEPPQKPNAFGREACVDVVWTVSLMLVIQLPLRLATKRLGVILYHRY